jgi:ParB family transcriptional regulator, chromosome partitioning protein
MSKRTDVIRLMFMQPQPQAPDPGTLSADNIAAPAPRVAAGAVRALKESFSDAERENEALREKLAAAVAVVEIDTSLIDPSPLADRFAEADDASFALLKASMAERGQEVPVLLRVSPLAAGRYQSAYGHRRIRAARELGRPVKAIVRALSDTDLVIAQGIENSARQDLSFIERAVFAARLEAAGHDRSVVQDALSVDRAEASKLNAVARAIPSDVIEAIGRAAKIGRGRWQAFADICAAPGALKRIRQEIVKDGFAGLDSNLRFAAAWAGAAKANKSATAPETHGTLVNDRAGRPIAAALRRGRNIKLSLQKDVDAGFADFVIHALPALFEAFEIKQASRDSAGD